MGAQHSVGDACGRAGAGEAVSQKGYEYGGRYSQDPINSHHEKGRSRSLSQQKSGRDIGLTPSEKRQKAVLMRQFMKNPEGSTNSEAYRNSAAWCKGCNGRRLAEAGGLCASCTERLADAAEAM